MIILLLTLLLTATAHAEDWRGYRGDERNSGYQPTRIERPLYLAHEIETVTGKYGNHQVDHVLVRGDSALLLTARAGGLPRVGHTFARGAMYLWRPLMDGLDSKGRHHYDLDYTWPFSTSLCGGGSEPIETSGGTPGLMHIEEGLTIMESGLSVCRRRHCQRCYFDSYGIVRATDDDRCQYVVSWEQWHKSSAWAQLCGRAVWSFGTSIPVGQESKSPQIFTSRSDAVFAGDYAVINQVYGYAHPDQDRGETRPAAGCGLSVWDIHNRSPELIATDCTEHYGMLSTDGKALYTHIDDLDRRHGEDWNPYEDGQRFAGEEGKSTHLVALSIPELRELWRVSKTLPAMYQDPPLVLPDRLVALAECEGGLCVAAYRKDTGERLWSTPVPAWRKKPQCAYYRNAWITQLAASGDTIAYVGEGVTLLDARTGEVRQKLATDRRYQNPIWVDGELWAVRVYGNRIDEQPVSRREELEARGYVYRRVARRESMMLFDGPPIPESPVPSQHTSLNCGGYAVDVFRMQPEDKRDVPPCWMDLDGDGTLDVADDVIFAARIYLRFDPVPPSWREIDPTIMSDEAILANFRDSDWDVDRSGKMDWHDLVAVARCVIGADPLSEQMEEHLRTACPSVIG